MRQNNYNNIQAAVCLLILFGGVTGCGTKSETPHQAVPEVVVEEVQTRDVESSIITTGYADSYEFVNVPARVSGALKEIRYTEGDIIVAGTPLFLIEPDQYQAAVAAAEANLAAAKADLLLGEANLTRTTELKAQNAVTQADLDTDTAKRDQAKASVMKAEADLRTAKLNLDYTDVRSPITGKAERSTYSTGNLVGSDKDNSTLTTVAGMDPIYILFDISDSQFNDLREQAAKTKNPAIEESIEKLRVIKEARQKEKDAATGVSSTATDPKSLAAPVSDPKQKQVHIPFEVGLIKGAAPNTMEYPYKGLIGLTGNKIDLSTGTIQMRGEIPNADYWIFPGQICRVRIPTFDQPGAVLVKESAIATDLNNKFVYVVDDKNIAHRQNVVLGELQRDNMRVITEGLKAGDKYVSVGTQRTRDGSAIKPTSPKTDDKPVSGGVHPALLPPETDKAAAKPTENPAEQPAAAPVEAPKPTETPNPAEPPKTAETK